jgi:hypothetical protein
LTWGLIAAMFFSLFFCLTHLSTNHYKNNSTLGNQYAV